MGRVPRGSGELAGTAQPTYPDARKHARPDEPGARHRGAQVFAWLETSEWFAFVPGALQHVAFALPGEKAALALRLRVQKTLYNDYGPTGAIMEPAELLSTLATLAMLRKRRVPTSLTLVALITVFVKFPVWALFIRPINEQALGWTEDSFPRNWEEMRDRWHRLHLLRFVLSAVGTSALLAGMLADTGSRSKVMRDSSR